MYGQGRRTAAGLAATVVLLAGVPAVATAQEASEGAPPDTEEAAAHGRVAGRPDQPPGLARLEADAGGDVRTSVHRETGYLRFVGTHPGQTIAAPAGARGATDSPEQAAEAFVARHGEAFGLAPPATVDRVGTTSRPGQGRGAGANVRFQQHVAGVPVLAGDLSVQVGPGNQVLSASGELLPVIEVDTVAELPAADAQQAAVVAVARHLGVDAADLVAGTPERWIHDPALLGGPGLAITRLVWRVEVTDAVGASVPVRTLVLVDADSGAVVEEIDQLAHAKDRWVCDNINQRNAPQACTADRITRDEGDPDTGISDVDEVYQYTGDTYDYFSAMFGRDSLDGAGMTLKSTVRYCEPAQEGTPCPYPNAFWDGAQMTYGQGVGSDDVVGHELSHGLTEKTANLFYYFQSGAINESMSDVFGELIDLGNGAGTDSAGVRWQIGEDSSLGTIRNMADPTLHGDPDRMHSPNYFAPPDGWNYGELGGDQGGVHINSGVNNKAAYLLTDGGMFNGHAVSPIGEDKTARVYYEVLTTLLTSGSDYADLYDGLVQACTNLIGSEGFTQNHCAEVQDAVDATEMNLDPLVASAPEAPLCDAGDPTDLYVNDIEAGAPGLTVDTGSWYYQDFFAHSAPWGMWGDAQPLSIEASMRTSTAVPIPAGSQAYLHFAHAWDFEWDVSETWDGGVFEVSTDNGATWDDATALFTHNGPNGTISTTASNSLGGRSGFVATSNGYVSSRVDLSSFAGQGVRFRWHIGTDEAVPSIGWMVDDLRVYTCEGTVAASPTIATNTGLTVSVGGSATITEAELEATDADTPAADLTYTIDVAPSSGVLSRDGLTLGVSDAFTQADIDAGLLAYTHDGTATLADTFAFTVSDPEANEVSGTFDITAEAPGLFAPYDTSAAGGDTWAVAIGDVTDDAISDVVTVERTGTGQVTVHPGGVGGIGAASSFAASNAQSVDVGDVNGDGFADVVLGTDTGIEVHLQTAGVLSTTPVPYGSAETLCVRIGDVTGDGRADVVAIGWGSDDVLVWAQDETGTLTGPTTYTANLSGYNDLELGDANGDRLLDVVMTSGQGSAPYLSVLLQDGDGGLLPADTYTTPGPGAPNGVAIGDVTGDGLEDLVVSHGGNQGPTDPPGIAVYEQLLDGSGFEAPATYASDDIPQPVELADVDGDGLLDVVTAHGAHSGLGVYLQGSLGTLGDEELFPIPHASHYNRHGLALGDVTADGAVEAALADTNNGLTWLENGNPAAGVPVNDAIADAVAFTDSGFSSSQDIYDGFHQSATRGASAEALEPHATGELSHSVWYSWTAGARDVMARLGVDSPTDVSMAVYRDVDGGATPPPMGGLELVASRVGVAGHDLLQVPVAAGETVWIQVDSVHGVTAPVSFNSSATSINDDFEHAIELAPAEGGSVGGDNTDATLEADEPAGTNPDGPFQTLWWTWTAPADGEVTFDLEAPSGGPLLNVFTGDVLGPALTEVAAADGLGATATSVSLDVVSGTTYRVRGDAVSGGPLTLDWCLDDVYEPNDTRQTAYDLGTGDEVDGRLCNDDDYYAITAAAGETIVADLTWDPADGPMTLQLLDADGNPLDEVIDSDSGHESVSRAVPSGDENYFVHVAGDGEIYSLAAEAGVLSRFEQSEAAFEFGAGWNLSSYSGYSGGSARYSAVSGASVSVGFTGSSVRLVGSVGPDRGIAEVFVDGVSQGTVDMYASSWAHRQVVFAVAGLSEGGHTLKVVHTGSANGAATNSYVVVDAIDAVGLVVLSRFEQSEAAFEFGAGWNLSSYSGYSGGSARYSAVSGASVSVGFTGSSVRLVGSVGPDRGIAEVFVDGVSQGTVDMYASSWAHRQVVFAVAGLSEGGHTLKVVHTGSANGAATNSYVVVDAIDAVGLVVLSRFEQSEAAFEFGAGWNLSSYSGYSGGSARYSAVSGASVSVGFTGSSVRLVGSVGPDRGIAEVFVDGVSQGTVDMYASSWAHRQVVFAVAGLSEGGHTLKVVHTGSANGAATNSYVVVDAIDAVGLVVLSRFEQSEAAFEFGAGWNLSSYSGYSGGSARYSAVSGASVSVGFTGSSVRLVGSVGPDRGIAEVFVDGVSQGTVDMYASSWAHRQVVFAVAGLSEGGHTLKVVHTGSANGAATNSYVVVDAIDAVGLVAG